MSFGEASGAGVTYHHSIPTRAEPRLLLAAAAGLLGSSGFAVTRRTSQELEGVGPGLRSTRQDPLLGASLIRVEADGQQLSVAAELGGVAWMERFMLRFPLGLGLGLAGLFLALAYAGRLLANQQGAIGLAALPWFIALIPLLAVAPWLILAPLLGRQLRVKTTKALDTLAHNICEMAALK